MPTYAAVRRWDGHRSVGWDWDGAGGCGGSGPVGGASSGQMKAATQPGKSAMGGAE